MSSYKVFYYDTANDDYFDACRQIPGQPLWKIYNCCQAQCASSPVCNALCSQIYPGTIMEDCSFDAGCWLNGFNQQCLVNQRQPIKDCCLRTCKSQGARVSTYIQDNTILPITDIPDCDKYCDEYKVV